MCGIAGYIQIRPQDDAAAALPHMAAAIAHRGPDGDGVWNDDLCGLGHTRLAIIDLSTAASQPMHSRDGRYVLTYNGEVYNFKELRSELEAAGCAFGSRSDTEVVLNAYAYWGAECVKRFNGMFAFAIWDRRKKQLFLARDRYGIKPLYYSLLGSLFLFGSEQKAILAHPQARRDLDLGAMLEYFTFQNLFTDSTFFKQIKMFPAGHFGVVNGDSGQLRLTRYWDYDFHEPDVEADPEEYAEELDRLFRQAVKRQMVSDVEVGAYLSSGLDSGGITAMAAQETPYIKSFTCGFEMHTSSGLELTYDEREKAEYLSYVLKTEHYEMVLKAGDMERCLPALTWHIEEPRVGQSYPNYYAAKLASRFGKVVLSGTGGDELFGGYPWRYYRTVTNASFEDYIDKYYQYWQRLIPNKLIKQIFTPVWGDVSHVWTRDIFKDVFASGADQLCRPEDYINHSLYFEAKTFLHGLFAVEDKLSMAHGLEARVPFMDNDLVDFAMQLPVRMKLNNLDKVVRINENEPAKIRKFYHKNRDGKKLLRDVLSKYVPDSVSNGVKQGFSGPDASWFKGDSIDYVKGVVNNDDSPIYSILDRGVVRKMVEEHLSGDENRRLFIWSLLVVNQWLKAYA